MGTASGGTIPSWRSNCMQTARRILITLGLVVLFSHCWCLLTALVRLPDGERHRAGCDGNVLPVMIMWLSPLFVDLQLGDRLDVGSRSTHRITICIGEVTAELAGSPAEASHDISTSPQASRGYVCPPPTNSVFFISNPYLIPLCPQALLYYILTCPWRVRSRHGEMLLCPLEHPGILPALISCDGLLAWVNHHPFEPRPLVATLGLPQFSRCPRSRYPAGPNECISPMGWEVAPKDLSCERYRITVSIHGFWFSCIHWRSSWTRRYGHSQSTHLLSFCC